MIMGAWGLGRKRLPYDAKVEWLESSKDQYIDTGVLAASDIEFEVWFSADAYSSTYFPIFGSWSNGNCLGFQRSSGASPYSLMAWRGSNTKKNITDNNALNYEGIVSLHGDTFTFLGNSTELSTSSFNGNTSIWYGRVNGMFNYGGVREIGMCKIWKAGVLVRDFIPVCFTNELGQTEGAMYDRANPTVGMDPDGSPRTDGLYRNRGTGAFLWAEKQ